MKYALINEQNLVKNLIWLYPSDKDEFPNAVHIDEDLPVEIGDEYRNGEFYHNGELVVTYATMVINQMQEAFEVLGVTVDEE